ncbi:hypothetical protein CONCODRAFT_8978 [Conidiobolus coronatus NRRL 28638]|uniref:Extracellular membrane protein CFEM domain-containing protein n=1 Tax=Conidiobolus coronatus (strain ATCC 28846 / CBS 209.66 / NRRL 28638) TaxID=796925 RepID=A0A137P184_CONC2|nr:hypothetical protein CONCODRAFT_8978 [Conidiobolus coronatus NRRL 28638]|eukprot:KXN68718.1 hypothetical protein CONCODRAFT_8978 [Conidiobolus coronatus NRRL 28638]
MKMNFTFIYSISILILSFNSKYIPRNCYSKLQCKSYEYDKNSDNYRSYANCLTLFLDDEEASDKCFCKFYGLNDKQCELYEILGPLRDQCYPLKEVSMIKCLYECSVEIEDNCFKSCSEFYQSMEGTCLAKLANKPNFDVRKSIECANSCNQVTYSEVFDCDYYCKKEVYKALIIKYRKINYLDKPLHSTDLKPSESSSRESSNFSRSESSISGDGNIKNNNSDIINYTNTKYSEDGSSYNGSNHSNSPSKQSNEDISIRIAQVSSSSSTSPQSRPARQSTNLTGNNYLTIFTITLATLLLLLIFNNLLRLY